MSIHIITDRSSGRPAKRELRRMGGVVVDLRVYERDYVKVSLGVSLTPLLRERDAKSLKDTIRINTRAEHSHRGAQ